MAPLARLLLNTVPEGGEAVIEMLRDDLPLGPDRAERLVDERLRRREMLASLHREARQHPELPVLADKLAALIARLRADMAEEERSLLSRDVIRDDGVVVDQTCG